MDTHGALDPYVRDLPYRSNFIPSQAPVLLSYVSAIAGFAPPDPVGAFRYVDLGCGSGITLNALAAACPGATFIGVDFNADSIAAARSAASAAGLSNVSYVQAPFSRLDVAALGSVDYLACSGTYSWLDSTEKDALVGIAGRCLKPGGLLYLGYVTLGRAAVTPMWQVLRRLAPPAGGSVERTEAGIRLLAEMRDQGARYLQQNPAALSLLNQVEAQSRAGDRQALENLAHNVFAEGFRAELLDDVAARLGPAGLAFAASASPLANDPDLSVPARLRARFDALESPVAQELFKDFLGAPLVRTDVFVKDAAPDPQNASQYLLNRVRVALVVPAAEAWQRLERPDWTAFDYTSPAGRYVFERIAGGAAGVREIAANAPFPPEDIADAFCKLAATPGFQLCLDPGILVASAPGSTQPASAFNRQALESARSGVAMVQLAAPLLGTCLPVPQPDALLLAELCADPSPASLQARVCAAAGRIAGLDPASHAQLADPRAFGEIQRRVLQRSLPVLLRFGALRA
jgi:ubiquinone/menaquinone biosynthesis C-methylase UbiE